VTTIKVKFERGSNCLMPESTFSQIAPYGFQQWSSGLLITMSTTSLSDYHIFVSCISGQEAMDLFKINPQTVGFAPYESSEIVYYARTKTGQIKYVERLYKSRVYFIWNGTSLFYSLDKWKMVSTHEFGHALGYYGHDMGASANNPAIMYEAAGTVYDKWKLTSPTVRDFTHIKNSYTKFYS